MKFFQQLLLAICLILCCKPITAQSYTLDSTVLTARTVISGIDIPWEISWGPDDHIWMTERYGRVSRVNPQTGQQEVLLDLSSQIYEAYEAGLLGLLLHPDFDNQPYVYLVYTYLQGNSVLERLVRYSYNGTILNNPQTLIDNIQGNTTHIGSRLMLLPDNTILMSTGDAQNLSAPQSISHLSGKILRLNLDGSIPADNPISGSYIWSWGHRNAQGLCLGPNNLIYSSEHGPTTDDELNILEPHSNYGWPSVQGFCDSPPEMTFCNDSVTSEPIAAWTPTIAPSDIIWYDHPSIPEFQHKLLMTVLKDKKIIAFGFDGSGSQLLSEDHYLSGQLNRLRDICVSPDGKIYLATNGSSWSNTNPFTHSIVELHNASYIPSSTSSIEKLTLSLFPNPLKAGQALQLSLQEQARIEIYDLYGRRVHQQMVQNQSSIDFQAQPGSYILKATLADGQQIIRQFLIY